MVRSALRGDAGFADLVQRYQGGILRYLSRTTGDRERAEDLAQETFLRVYRHLPRFDTSRRLAPWIFTIAANLARSERRARARARRVSLHLVAYQRGHPHAWPVPCGVSRPDECCQREELCALVADAIGRLPAGEREVLELRVLRGLAYHEIAATVGRPVGTVKSRLNRARAHVAARIRPALP